MTTTRAKKKTTAKKKEVHVDVTALVTALLEVLVDAGHEHEAHVIQHLFNMCVANRNHDGKRYMTELSAVISDSVVLYRMTSEAFALMGGTPGARRKKKASKTKTAPERERPALRLVH